MYVTILKRSLDFIPSTQANESIINHLDRFFLLCSLTASFKLVKIENILTNCVLLQNNNEYLKKKKLRCGVTCSQVAPGYNLMHLKHKIFRIKLQ